MATTLARKAWRDLGRRRARAILTSATIALAVAGIGMLAVPTLIDRTMSAEVRETKLYDLTLAVRDMPFDAATSRELAAIPNVSSVSARVTYSTRALIGERRIPASLWSVDDFARQAIDVVRVTSGAVAANGQVLADEANADAIDIRRAFAAESAVQAALGWVVGIPLGFLLSWGLRG